MAKEYVTAKEFFRKAKEEMEFTKDMLETGMVAEVKDGELFLILKDVLNAYGSIKTVGIGLGCDEHYSDMLAKFEDVVKVYKPNIREFSQINAYNKKLIWKRNDQKDEALKELEEAKAELKKAQEKIEAAENKIKGCE